MNASIIMRATNKQLRRSFTCSNIAELDMKKVTTSCNWTRARVFCVAPDSKQIADRAARAVTQHVAVRACVHMLMWTRA